MFSTINFSNGSNADNTNNSDTPSSSTPNPFTSTGRGGNWTQAEVMLLIETYSRCYSPMECTSNSLEKQVLVNQLTKDFNDANVTTGRQPRVEKPITRKWDNLCGDYRRQFRERSQTGQGTFEADPVYEEMNKILFSLPIKNAPFRYSSHTGVLANNTTPSTPSTTTPPSSISSTRDDTTATTNTAHRRPPSPSFSGSDRLTSRRRTEVDGTSPSSSSLPPPPPSHGPIPSADMEHNTTQRQQRSTTTQQRNESVYTRILDGVLDRQLRERQAEAALLREECQLHTDRFDAYFQQWRESHDRLHESIREGNEILRSNSQTMQQLVTLLERSNSNNNNE